MKTMKKFGKYLILFVIFFLFVSGMTYLGTIRNRNNIRNIEYSTTIDIPISVNMEKCQATNRKAYVKGNIVNETGELITDKYLQISFFNDNNAFLGSNFEEIKFFNATEKIPFDFIVNGNHINKVVISLVDESVKMEYEKNNGNILSTLEVSDNAFWGTFLAFLIFA